ncbi:type 4a pilus biogenesis protein PilO [Enterovibrio nigricans]|uniref:Type IV pilus assembly protein PilO n=1 Tax=Enterovibrio nigricans DSM 22720 TaxID=1121868 RepID=A0A1T4U921_9GAMM|nr:type 4a pilus biogenesis protein PilO [Enterovibrio nigricans]PKF51538.1 pilus assembly protein PilO [Enterovibrio nigricans]SKA49100.1 type IV pilus assembly protein PilO [Enterovibrio nigricans DSM 22720]
MDADWRDWELDEIPEWSSTARRVVLTVAGLLVLVAGLMFVVLPSYDKITMAEQEEVILKNTFRFKAQRVAALPDVDEQVEALNRFYLKLTQQLPQDEELAQLLAGINDIGQQYGLSFERLDWGYGEQVGWLYKVPLEIVVTGSYEGIGQFSEAMARLPRIVALQDFNLKREGGHREVLNFSVAAHTYRYIDRNVEGL